MDNKLLKIAVRLLRDYDKMIGDRSCNELPDDVYADWSDAEKVKLVDSLNKYNGHGKEEDGDYEDLMYYDFVMCGFIAEEIEKQIGGCDG